MSNETIEKTIESLKKEGKIPQDAEYKIIEKFSEADIGKLIVIEAQVKGIAVKLSPRIKATKAINKDEEQKSEVDLFDGLKSKLLDIDIEFSQGYLISHDEQEKNLSQHRDFFNSVISLMNILGIPLDYVSTFDIIYFMENSSGTKLETLTSSTAKSRGITYDTVEITEKEISLILYSMFIVWEAIKKSKMLNSGNLYSFLGYGRYYYFHQNFLLSFVNSWMFIEPMINLIWEEKVIENGFSKTYLEENKGNWTSHIKIDELFIMGYFDKDTKDSIQGLRKKRNKVFHVDEDEKLREISEEDARHCFSIGLQIFYKYLNFIEEGEMLEFQEIANRFYNAIHKNPSNLR
ncbi:MAG: hypothetical protein WAW23_12885 [Candidatus Methanoperedens sp.]